MRRRDDTDAGEYPTSLDVREQPTTPVVDPVCGAAVVPEEAIGPSTYGGERYFFCSDTCQRRFDVSPEEYASARHVIRIPIA